MSAAADPAPSSAAAPGPAGTPATDARLRIALRYSLSPAEYQLLHKYLIAHAPAVRRRALPPARYESIVRAAADGDDYNASTFRAGLRVFASAYAALRLWEFVARRLYAPRGKPLPPVIRPAFWKQGSVRLAASLSFILVGHRLLHRFLLRLRQSLQTDNARPFRRRNPRISGALTARLAPVVGASMAGWFLGVYPATQLRITITLYVFSRSLEFFYNHLEDKGWFKNKPWWFGSWLLMPAVCGQLFHAFIFDRECFPASYGGLITRNSTAYLQPMPKSFPDTLKWPTPDQIIDSLGEISKLKWPKFVSPIMFPSSKTLPSTALAISHITSPAHPTIQNLSCALLHPHDPSCARTYLTFFFTAFPGIVRYFAVIFGAFSLLRIQAFVKTPITAFSRLARVILRTSVYVTGAVGTAWGSVCLMQHLFPGRLLPTKRWVLGGAMGGMWAFMERKTGRGNFLFSARLSMDSLWKVGVKRGWWKGIKNGDVLLFVASLAFAQAIYEINPKAVNSPLVRKALSMLRGDGWVDRAVMQEKEAADAKSDEEKKTA